MNLVQIKTKAKELGIKPGRMKKAEIIHTIQKKEGNFDCFRSAADYCDQWDCSFRDGCLDTKKVN